MINYCQAVGNSKGAPSSNSHLFSSFMNTRPDKALHNDSCFSTKVQGGWLLENFRRECYLPFLLFGRCNWNKILTFCWEISYIMAQGLSNSLLFYPSYPIYLSIFLFFFFFQICPVFILSSLVASLMGLDHPLQPRLTFYRYPLILTNLLTGQSRWLFIDYSFFLFHTWL